MVEATKMGRSKASPADATSADLGVRAAWLYYVEGLTQEQIARLLDVSRVKVMRLLAAARDDGTVRIRIDRKAAEQVAMERRLADVLGLEEVIVVPSAKEAESAAALVGHAAGAYISDQARDGLSLAIGWGETLRLMLRALSEQSLSGVSVISLLGGMTHSRAVNPSSVARRVADRLGADCYQLTAPVVVSSQQVRDLLWQEPGLGQLLARVQSADLALVSVGNLSRHSTLFREGLLPVSEIATLEKAGAVGDVLCHFIDGQGRIIDHPLNRRVMAIGLEQLRKVPKVVIAAGGAEKSLAVTAAITAVRARVLITDTACAEGMLRIVAHASPAHGAESGSPARRQSADRLGVRRGSARKPSRV